MDEKKSLGSSPIGFGRLNNSSYHFIRDLGVSQKKENSDAEVRGRKTNRDARSSKKPASEKKSDKQAEKKIVSYYLDLRLIKRLKALADNNGFYYSTVASKAIEDWLERHGY